MSKTGKCDEEMEEDAEKNRNQKQHTCNKKQKEHKRRDGGVWWIGHCIFMNVIVNIFFL